MMADHAAILDAYVATLQPPDLVGARRLATKSLDEGMAATTFIEEIIGPAQEQVGCRWHAGEWTVAQEHAATAIADSVLASVSLRAAAAPLSTILEPITLDPLTVADDPNFLTMIANQPNVPDPIRTGLAQLY